MIMSQEERNRDELKKNPTCCEICGKELEEDLLILCESSEKLLCQECLAEENSCGCMDD